MSAMIRKQRKVIAPVLLSLLCSCAVTPQPISVDDRRDEVKGDVERMFRDAPNYDVGEGIDLYEAMALAIRHNLDHRLKVMEHALELRQTDVANMEMLPELALNAGYVGRHNEPGGVSQSLATGNQSLEASKSQERHRNVSDLSMSWNVLDFGVSYFQAKERADLALIAQERRRKVIQNTVQDVRIAFWRAVAAQEVEALLPRLRTRIKIALKNAEKEEALRLRNPIDSLDYQRSLLQAQSQLQALEKEVELAKTQLAALINMPPDEALTLESHASLKFFVPRVGWEMEALEEMALLNRPELIEESYQKRISVHQTKAALLQALPGISFDVGANYDSNRFTFNNRWVDYGLNVGWNLMNVLRTPARYDAAKINEQLVDARRMALSMAVLSQVHIARRELDYAREDFVSSYHLARVERRIQGHMRSQMESRRIGELDVILTDVNAIAAIIQRNLSYGAMQNSLARLYQSVGLDPLPLHQDSYDIASLAEAIEEREYDWQKAGAPERFYPISLTSPEPKQPSMQVDLYGPQLPRSDHAGLNYGPQLPERMGGKPEPLLVMEPVHHVKVTPKERVDDLFSMLGFRFFDVKSDVTNPLVKKEQN